MLNKRAHFHAAFRKIQVKQVLVCLLVLGTISQQVSAGQIKPHVWPFVGIWGAVLMPTDDGGAYCGLVSKPRGSGIETYEMAFAFRQTTSHLYLTYDGPSVPTGNKIDLSTDGNFVISLPVIGRPQIAPGHWVIMADVPGRKFIETVAPALSTANTISLSGGGPGIFEFPIWGWDKIYANLAEACQEYRDSLN